MCLYLVMQPLPFPAQNEHRTSGILHLVVQSISPLVDAVDPETGGLQRLQGSVQIDRTYHGEVLQSPGRGLGDDIRQTCGAPLGNDHRVRPCGVGRADDSAEIVRVLDAVQQHQHPGRADYTFQGDVAVRGGYRDHALMGGASRQPVERGPRLEADGDLGGTAKVHNLLNAGAAGASGDQDPLDRAAGLERFRHRVNSGQCAHAAFMVARGAAGGGAGLLSFGFLSQPVFQPSVYHVNRSGRLCGFLVIHSFFRGSACGGMRMALDISEEEVRLLAEGMTLKFGLLGLPQGGAKAGIRADPDAPEEERFAALREFGQGIRRQLRDRVYVPGPDMGTSNEMVRRMLLSLGIPVRRRHLRGERSGYFTALTVFSAVQHAAAEAGLELKGARVAIEGFGKVGSSLAALLAGLGARIIAISTSRGALHADGGLDIPDLARCYREQGSRFVEAYAEADRIPAQDIFRLPVEVLCPCARHNTISSAMAGNIQAGIIAPGANHPFDLHAERALTARGIVCIPYWVANCGGTLGETMEFAGWRDPEIADFIHRKLAPHVQSAIRDSRKTGLTPTELTKARTFERFARAAAHATSRGLKGSLMDAGLECYRRGLVPTAVVRSLSRDYFERQVLLPFD